MTLYASYILMFLCLCSAVLYADDFRRQYAPFACIVLFGASVALFTLSLFHDHTSYQNGYNDGIDANKCLDVIKYAWALERHVIIDGIRYKVHLEEIQ